MDALLGMFAAPVLYGVSALFVLTIVVFFHELGHFLVARWCGVNVKAFSIGFGQEIFGFDDRYGTRWKFCWIPLGGYVKFMDDDNAASVPSQETIANMSETERAGSFHAKPVWQRAAVVVAGPMANFILAIVIFSLWFFFNGVYSSEARVTGVVPDSPAAAAGLQPGDLITAIDGQPVASFDKIQRVVGTNVDNPLTFKVDRNGQSLDLQVTPKVIQRVDDKGDKISMVMIGVESRATPETIKFRSVGALESVRLGAGETWFIVTSTMGYFRDVFVGRQSGDQVGGLIRITDLAGRVAEQGPHFLIRLAAALSVGIGLLNLFPIPLLDGGHLMFYAIEAARGRPLTERVQEIGFRIGLAVVLGLMVFATFNDLHILKRWVVGAG